MIRTLFFVLACGLLTSSIRAADARNTNLPGTDTHFTMPEYKTLAQWEARKKELREQILFTAGLDPMPDFGPIKAEVFGKISHADYSIEKVLIETRPGYFLGGNLYRPVGKQGPFPGIASPHGHWIYGRLENQPLGSIPARGISLARQGFVVFTYDMVGYNDTTQTPHDFQGKAEQLWNFGPLGLQLWNSMRVVDFLQSLPDVNKDKIGATGASGGGTQTFLLTAVDDRVKFSSPVNMISAIMQGGSPCENTPGLRVGAFNVEIGAMMAPRPMLMVSATGDWTKNTMKEEYPAIEGIYELYDRASLVEAVQLDAPHNYNKDSREKVYQFFGKVALGDTDGSKFKEKGIRVEQLQNMMALYGRTLPAGALNYDGVFAQWRGQVMEQLGKITEPGEKRRLLRLAIGASWPAKVEAKENGEWFHLTRPGVGDQIPVSWKKGAGAVTLTAGGKSLSVDVFQTGRAVAPRDRSKAHFLTFNRSEDALRVQDILTAVRYLELKGFKNIELSGSTKAAAVWCRFAAALSPVKVKLAGGDSEFFGSDKELLESFNVPGIQRAGGWKFALELTQTN